MKAHHPMNDEETGASLTAGARADALRALRVLAETAEPAAAEDVETPPLPAHLRDQWLETYGETAPSSTSPARTPAPSATGSREGWVSRLAGFFTRPRVAWTGGLTAAAAAVLILILHQPETTTTNGPGGVGIVTRGGGDHSTVTPGTAARVIVVAPADKAGTLLKELAQAFPLRVIERVDQGPSGLPDQTIVIDTGAGILRRSGQDAVQALDGDPLTNPAVAIMAIEKMDEPEPR